MPYVDLSFQNPLADIGARMRQMDAYNTAGNSLADGDYTGARNSLMQFGYPDAAQKVQQIQDANDANNRANAAEARTVADRDLAKTIGAQYAGGDTAGAKKAAIAAGHLDLANDYGNYETTQANAAQEQAKRAAIADAAKMTAAGNPEGARQRLMPFYSSVDNFMTELRQSQQDVAKKAGELALAFDGDPQGWQNTGIPALRKMGIDPTNFEDEAGRQALLAKAGLSSTVYKAEQAQQNKAATGDANTRHAQAMLASFQSDNPDIQVPSSEYQKLLANKEYMLQPSTDAQGNRTAIAVMVDGRTKTAVDAAERVVKENEAANAKDGGSRPTDFYSVYRDVSGKNSQAMTAEARMRMTNPELRGEISRQSALGQADAKITQRSSSAVQAMNHAATLDTIADLPGANDVLGTIASNGGYQRFLNLLNSGRVKEPALWGNLHATAAVLAREIANAAHVPGTGAETDARNAEMRQSIEGMLLDSPNTDVLHQRVANMRALAKGYVNAPLPSELYKDQAFQTGRKQGAAEATATIQAPEVNGQIQRPSVTAPPRPAWAPPGSGYSPSTGKWYTRDGQEVAPPTGGQ